MLQVKIPELGFCTDISFEKGQKFTHHYHLGPRKGERRDGGGGRVWGI
jgi:hypothetical protein